MTLTGKLCVLIAALGALNWTALHFVDTDLHQALLGGGRSMVAHAVFGAVAMAALYSLVATFKSKKS